MEFKTNPDENLVVFVTLGIANGFHSVCLPQLSVSDATCLQPIVVYRLLGWYDSITAQQIINTI